jgi:hypothetical protein
LKRAGIKQDWDFKKANLKSQALKLRSRYIFFKLKERAKQNKNNTSLTKSQTGLSEARMIIWNTIFGD